ncbi:MAG: site-2 protease family protein [Polyangiales bacterium]
MTLSMLVSVNVAWGLMNLLPIPPLDGGHVLLEFRARAESASPLRRHRHGGGGGVARCARG